MAGAVGRCPLRGVAGGAGGDGVVGGVGTLSAGWLRGCKLS
jgi:hypothetical protein